MKKIAFTLLALSPFFAANAQEDTSVKLRMPTQKGNYLIGSNLLLSSVGFESDSRAIYNIGISPRVGYFLKDNFAVGLSANAYFTGATYSHSKSFGVSAFGRYYFGKSAEKDGSLKRARFFVEAGVGFSGGRYVYATVPDDQFTYNYTVLSPYIMPGFNYFISKNVALEASVYYQRNISGTVINGVSDKNKLGLNVGMQIFLKKK